MYKLRIYKTYGGDKGNLDHEEIFDTKEQMDKMNYLKRNCML